MSATTASPAPAKLCNGTVLAPIRMADAATASAQKSFLTRATGGYVPPSMRRTPSFPDTPKSVTSVNSASREEFPTLGSTPKPVISGTASWTQIRTRFHPEPAATSTPPPSTPVPDTPTSSTNQFAALDDDSVATPKSSSVNFKKVIEERIKREEAERLGLYEAEPTDPQKMTREQLERNGWAVLSLPPAEHGEARKAWYAERSAREVEREAIRKAREEIEEVMGTSYSIPIHTGRNPFLSGTRPPAPTLSQDEVFDDANDEVFSVGDSEEEDGCDSVS